MLSSAGTTLGGQGLWINLSCKPFLLIIRLAARMLIGPEEGIPTLTSKSSFIVGLSTVSSGVITTLSVPPFLVSIDTVFPMRCFFQLLSTFALSSQMASFMSRIVKNILNFSIRVDVVVPLGFRPA